MRDTYMSHGKFFFLATSLSALCAAASAQSVKAETTANMTGHFALTANGTTSVSLSDTADNDYALRNAWTDVRMGIVKAHGRVDALAPSGLGISGAANWAGATGTWKDTLTFNAPGFTGQTGTFTFQFLVDGTLDAVGMISEYTQSYAAARVEVRANGNTSEYSDTYYSVDGLTSTVAGGLLGNMMSQTVSFTYGIPFDLSFSLQAYASTKNSSNYPIAYAQAALGHTATWEGITSVTAGGNEVTNFTLSSASGTNYVNAVPEPASMAALGLGALGLLRRRARN